jgi:hypothetical protein
MDATDVEGSGKRSSREQTVQSEYDGRMLTLRGMGSIVCYELALQSLNLDELPTGEPDPGEPDVRFGGRGGANQCAIPTPIDLPNPRCA